MIETYWVVHVDLSMHIVYLNVSPDFSIKPVLSPPCPIFPSFRVESPNRVPEVCVSFSGSELGPKLKPGRKVIPSITAPFSLFAFLGLELAGIVSSRFPHHGQEQ